MNLRWELTSKRLKFVIWISGFLIGNNLKWYPDVNMLVIRGANLSPFGEIRRFHLEIGHSRESCRSVKKIFEGRGGGVVVVVVSESHLCHVTCSVFSPVGKGIDPPYSASDWLTLMLFPSSNQSHSWSLAFRRRRQLSIFRMECICIGCKLWCSSLNGDYRVRLLFCLFDCFCFAWGCYCDSYEDCKLRYRYISLLLFAKMLLSLDLNICLTCQLAILTWSRFENCSTYK